MDRKLFLASVAFIIGNVVGQTASSLPYGLVVMLALLVLQTRRPQLGFFVIVVLIALLGIINGAVRQPSFLEPTSGSWAGRAISQPELTAGGWYCGQILLEEGKHKVTVYAEEPWKDREILQFRGEMAPALKAQNPGQFDYQALLARQGVSGVIFASSMQPVARYR